VLPPLTRPLARTAGYVIDALQGKVGDARANRLVRETVGDQLNAMRQVMAMYPDELPSRIVANMNTKGDLDALQTLLATAEQSDRAKTIKALRQTEKEDVINALTRIAGGATSEEARAARETAKGALTNVTTPLREEAFAAARRTGEVMPKLETIATEARAEAKTNVDKVRRFSEAVNKADDWAKNWVTDSRLVQQPDGTFTREYVTNQGVGEAGVRLPAQAEQRYTYPGQLAAGGRESTVGGPFERQVIDEGGVIAKRIREAAETSVQAGARARAAENTLQSMKDRGLQPIESAKLTASINGLLGSPEVATNREASRAIPRVVEMINDWTNQNGVVTPEALYAIRKNAVAGVIRELNPTMDAKAQERFAAQVMSSIKPVFDTAIEKAGGKAFKDYLLSFERGMSDIKGMELADKIRKLYADGTPAAKQQIVDLVKGESPDVVEELFGSGRYKIGKEMSKDMKLLQQIANNAGLDLAALEQAKSGVKPLTAIMESQSYKLRFPFFTRVSTGFNEALAALEKKTKRETMDKIIKAAQSGKDFNELLDAIPAKERSAFLEQFKNADSWGKFTGNVAQAMSAQTTATPRNKLAPTSQNALAQ
jgi:hypothetical protein